MSAATQQKPRFYTAEDLQNMPGDARYELIRGELCPMPDNSAEHGKITARLSGPVIVFVQDNELGECFAAETRFTIEEDPDTSIGPDLAFVARERLPAPFPSKGYLRLAPDLVVETVSPNDTRREVNLKIGQWLRAGTRLVWVIDPEKKTLTVHRPGAMPHILGVEDTLIGEDVLPGFEFPLRKLFRETAQERS